jgi:hypothetical protein
MLLYLTLTILSWIMGTCIPKKLLGYLSRKQRKLESLILITDGDCTYNREGLSPIDLSAFLCLRKLSWTGIRSGSDMKALRVALKQVTSLPTCRKTLLPEICLYSASQQCQQMSGGTETLGIHSSYLSLRLDLSLTAEHISPAAHRP